MAVRKVEARKNVLAFDLSRRGSRSSVRAALRKAIDAGHADGAYLLTRLLVRVCEGRAGH